MSAIGTTETIWGSAARPVFPFVIVRFEESGPAKESVEVTVKVRREVYKYLTQVYGGDRVILYLDALNSKMEAWGPSMNVSINTLVQLGLMSQVDQWVKNAREYLTKLVSKIRIVPE